MKNIEYCSKEAPHNDSPDGLIPRMSDVPCQPEVAVVSIFANQRKRLKSRAIKSNKSKLPELSCLSLGSILEESQYWQFHDFISFMTEPRVLGTIKTTIPDALTGESSFRMLEMKAFTSTRDQTGSVKISQSQIKPMIEPVHSTTLFARLKKRLNRLSSASYLTGYQQKIFLALVVPIQLA
jgi:hypothetical protein